jgi:hypothetical protein
MHKELYEKTIYENEAKAYQLRLVCSEFRGEQYIHIRKYFLSYEGDYLPSKEGVSMLASMSNIYSLLDGLLEIVSKEEAIEAISTYFSDKIIDLNSPIV